MYFIGLDRKEKGSRMHLYFMLVYIYNFMFGGCYYDDRLKLVVTKFFKWVISIYEDCYKCNLILYQ